MFSGIAWIVIPMDFRFEYEYFRFSSWNLFVAICSLPSIFIGLWLFTFPESPKFLLECGEPDAALDVLREMYEKNTGKDSISFPVSYCFTYIRIYSGDFPSKRVVTVKYIFFTKYYCISQSSRF